MPNGGKRPGAGRKKGSLAKHTLEAQELRKRLIERIAPVWDDIIDTMIEKAALGDSWAIKEINDRILGKPIQPMEHSGKDGAAILVQQITGMTIALNANPVSNDKSKTVSSSAVLG